MTRETVRPHNAQVRQHPPAEPLDPLAPAAPTREAATRQRETTRLAYIRQCLATGVNPYDTSDTPKPVTEKQRNATPTPVEPVTTVTKADTVDRRSNWLKATMQDARVTVGIDDEGFPVTRLVTEVEKSRSIRTAKVLSEDKADTGGRPQKDKPKLVTVEVIDGPVTVKHYNRKGKLIRTETLEPTVTEWLSSLPYEPKTDTVDPACYRKFGKR